MHLEFQVTQDNKHRMEIKMYPSGKGIKPFVIYAPSDAIIYVEGDDRDTPADGVLVIER